MRSRLSKSLVYRSFLIVSLVLTLISTETDIRHVQFAALVPFNSQPLFNTQADKKYVLPESCQASL